MSDQPEPEYVPVPARCLLRLGELAVWAEGDLDPIDVELITKTFELVRALAPTTWATHCFAEQLARLPTATQEGARP